MLKIFKEERDMISQDPIWVCLDPKGYLYTAPTFLILVYIIVLNWRHDRHLIG